MPDEADQQIVSAALPPIVILFLLFLIPKDSHID